MFWIVGASLRYAQAQRLPKGAVAYSGGSPVWLLPSQPHSFMDPAIRVFATLRHKYMPLCYSPSQRVVTHQGQRLQRIVTVTCQ